MGDREVPSGQDVQRSMPEVQPERDSHAPRYTLSVNLELMFPPAMAWEDRLELVGKLGEKAFSFWDYRDKNLDMLLAIQERYGLRCGSISGANSTGWGTGLTRTGYEKDFLDDVASSVRCARRMHCANLVTFVGATQADIAWETQYAQIVSGLKTAGDIAAEGGVVITLEPLNAVEAPQMSITTTDRAYRIVRDVSHPNVKVNFDMYHRQLGEGNLVNTLEEGLDNGYVAFVEVGDVPGRLEPGTGEVNYARLFRLLRERGYDGLIGLEHGASSSPADAIRAVRKLAGLEAVALDL